MHKVRKILQIQGKFAYSFLLLGIGIGIVLVLLYFFFSSRIVAENIRAEIFPEGVRYARNQIIVKYRAGFSPHALKAQNKTKEIERLEEEIKRIGVISQNRLFTSDNLLLENYYILNLPQDSDIQSVYAKLSKLSEIDAVSPDYILSVQEIPDDPAYSTLWGLSEISAPKAWDIKNGKSNVMVGIVDTGVDLNHEDLKGNVIKGINTVDETRDPSDDHGHGTHVAGTVGAVTNNAIGISSISWGAKLLAVKSCDENGDCKTSDVSRGIKYAIDKGAKIVNVSVAGEGSCRGTYDDISRYAKEKNVLLVVAAGNGIQGKGVDAKKWIPAGCNDIFTVGAIGPSGDRASYSNYGDVLSISAPGGDRGAEACTESTCILSTSNNNTYSLRQGTSMAAPQVSGAAALLLSYNPLLSVSQIRSCLTQGGDQLKTDKFIGKKLNAQKALMRCAPIALSPTPVQSIEDSGDLSISGIVYVDANDDKSFDSSEKPIVGAQVILSGYGSQSVLSNSTGRYIFPDLRPGFYTISVSIDGQSVGDLYDVSLQNLFPNVQIDLPIFLKNLPTPVSGQKPQPTQKASSIQCVPDPSCESAEGSIQICSLKCE